MKKIIATAFAFSSILSINSAQAESIDGKSLYDESCVRCHSTDIYSKPERKIHNLKKLGTQVRLCRDNLNVSWFDEDVDAVINYLDKSHYKF